MIDINTIPNRREPLYALMCRPDYFSIIDVKNVHMRGNEGGLNAELFKKQWDEIHKIYQKYADDGIIDGEYVLDGAIGCEDMVFCANQSFPWLDKSGNHFVIMSRMRYPSRQNEVQFFEEYYKHIGYKIQTAPGNGLLEGMGDLIPMPGKRLIFGGYGHRTDLTTLESLSAILEADIVTLQLVNEAFYHLDTCFIPLDTQTALIAKEAFDEDGNGKIKSYFKEVIEIPFEEASKKFALNAHVVNNQRRNFAIIQKGNPFTTKVLSDKGYLVHEVDTSEYIKSGGSVFCMKMMHY